MRRILFACLAMVGGAVANAEAPSMSSGAVVQHVTVTVLSTMLADDGIGEWGFAALVDVDGTRILVDTGARPDTVLQNARELHVDLAGVKDVVLTHFHGDHVGGLMTLRDDVKARHADGLGTVHVARGAFFPRPLPGGGEGNGLLAIRSRFEATGGTVIEHSGMTEIRPGLWLTGPVPREFPERNWSGSGQVLTPGGLVKDTVPEDQSLIIDTAEGLVVVTGCGHAGIVNILTAAVHRLHKPVIAVIGGLHLFSATDAQVDWTGDRMKAFGVRYLVGAHCTGIESVFRLRSRLGLDRRTAVVGAVGSSFVLGDAIHAGRLAQ